nr:MAG TPA: hypothetical protein [Caudoviricetes sp.]
MYGSKIVLVFTKLVTLDVFYKNIYISLYRTDYIITMLLIR